MELNQQYLSKRSQNARVMSSKASSKMLNMNESKDKEQQDQLNLFVHKFTLKEKKLSKFNKELQRRNKDRVEKRTMHMSMVYENQKHLRNDFKERQQQIEEKHTSIDRATTLSQQSRQRHLLLRQERENLRMNDTVKNLERQKWLQSQQKARVFEKHLKITDKLGQMKYSRLKRQEFSRMANEMRVMRKTDQMSIITSASGQTRGNFSSTQPHSQTVQATMFNRNLQKTQ